MDLTLDLAEDEHTISGSLEFSTDLFERSTVERMAGHLEVPRPGPEHSCGLRGRAACAPAAAVPACAGAGEGRV